MDIKPQRPRTRVFGDENAAPQYKTLHSRHKSQPVLKAGLVAAGPQKFGNRNVFGDVSNLATNKLLREENGSKVKPGSLEPGKVILKDVNTKPTTALARGLVRPTPTLRATASSIALKSASTKAYNGTDNTQKPAARPLRKAKTTIFKEKEEVKKRPVIIEQDLAISHQSPVGHVSSSNTSESAAGAKTNVDKGLESVLEPALRISEKPAEQWVIEQCTAGADTIDLLETQAEPVETFEPVEPISITSLPSTNVIDSLLEIDSVDTALASIEEASSPLMLDELEQYESALEVIPETFMPEEAIVDVRNAVEQELCEPNPPDSATLPEPEEYWDVEEDDGYVDDGYVTARSFKSIGESHTSGYVTRTLYPYIDQAVKRELAAAKALVESTLDPAEVEDEAWDTSMVQEYGDEIFEYMRELEVRMSPNPHYMDKQTEIQWSMRSVLMDWIVQVHHRFGLLPETLFLCINLIDRFLSQKVVSLTKLQLVGATAIFVAAKYEEVDCPSVQEINFMVDNGYGVDEILKAERFMLTMLGFELGFPGPMSFLRRISKADDYDLETRTLAKYFLEITIMDERFLTCVPSFTAAGAHCLARMMLHKGNWSPAHVYYSNYTYSQLQPLIALMLECCEDPVHHHNAIYEKYLDKRYKQAAKYVQSELDNGFRIPGENINVPSSPYTPILPASIDQQPYYPSYWPQAL